MDHTCPVAHGPHPFVVGGSDVPPQFMEAAAAWLRPFHTHVYGLRDARYAPTQYALPELRLVAVASREVPLCLHHDRAPRTETTTPRFVQYNAKDASQKCRAYRHQ
jgi:hypothetical protein